MKFKLFLIYIIFYTNVCCNAKTTVESEKKNDIKLMGLKGNVKSIRESIYKAIEINGVYIKQEKTSTQFQGRFQTFIFFNQNGYITEKIEHDVNINDYIRTINRYDVNNNIIENSIYDLLQNCTSKKVFVFNKQNKIDEQRNYISNKEIEGITKYKYDKKGYLIESIDYNLKGKIDKKIIFKNDYKGKPIELFEYDSSGQLKRRKNRQYDNNGNVIETIHSDGYKFTSKYDEKNNQIEENTYDGKRGLIQKESTIYGIDKIRVFKKILYEKDYNGNESYKTTKFDKHGNEIEFISKRNEGGRIIFEKLFYDNKYNDNGNKVEIKSYFEDKLKTIKTWKYDKTGKIIKFSDCLYGGFGSIPGYSKDDVVTINNYEYDKNNNLIKRIYISSWEGAFIFEKEIEYYK